mgnify:CR=1 FL=1
MTILSARQNVIAVAAKNHDIRLQRQCGADDRGDVIQIDVGAVVDVSEECDPQSVERLRQPRHADLGPFDDDSPGFVEPVTRARNRADAESYAEATSYFPDAGVFALGGTLFAQSGAPTAPAASTACGSATIHIAASDVGAGVDPRVIALPLPLQSVHGSS